MPKAVFLRGSALFLILAVFASPVAAERKKTGERLDSLESRVDRLDKVLESQALMDMSMRIEELERELSTLRGENEQLNHELSTLKSRQRELYLDVDRRIQELEAGVSVTSPPAQAPAGQAAPPTGSPTAAPAAGVAAPGGVAAAKNAPATPSAEEHSAYKEAFGLLKTGRYASAISAFRKFLNDYPQSGYAANAQYWLGEANYVSKDYKSAVTEFSKVLQQYPDSSKVPDASLKLGFTYYELEQWKQARETLTGVTKNFSGTTVARLADQRLKRMTREGH